MFAGWRMSKRNESWRELPATMKDAARELEEHYEALRKKFPDKANKVQTVLKRFASDQSQEKVPKEEPPEYMSDLIILAEELRDVAHRLAELSDRKEATAQTPPIKKTS